MTWKIEYLGEAVQDLASLDQSQRVQVLKAILKVSENPLPISEGGFGKPLGNHFIENYRGIIKSKL